MRNKLTLLALVGLGCCIYANAIPITDDLGFKPLLGIFDNDTQPSPNLGNLPYQPITQPQDYPPPTDYNTGNVYYYNGGWENYGGYYPPPCLPTPIDCLPTTTIVDPPPTSGVPEPNTMEFGMVGLGIMVLTYRKKKEQVN